MECGSTRQTGRDGADDGARDGAAALVVGLIADLLAVDGDLDTRIEEALARLGRFAGVDRAYVIRIRDTDTFDNTHEWVAPGVPSGKQDLQGIPTERMNPELRRARQPLYIASVPDLPPEAPHREHLIAQGIHSLLIAPMIDGERRIGLVGFDAVTAPRAFGEAEREVLTTFARLLTNIILRAEAEALAEAARLRLAKAEARLRTTLAAVPDAVLDLDAEGRITDAHSRVPGLLTTRKTAALQGQPMDAALGPCLVAACRRCLDGLTTGQADRTETVELEGQDNAPTRWIEITAAAHEATGCGADTGSVIVLRDVTAERRNAAERDMLDQVARRTHNLVVVTDAQRRITWVNEAFERRSGYALAEVIGRNPGDFLQTEETDKAEVQRIHETLEAGQPITAELLNVARDGTRYWVEIDIQPLRAPDGRVMGFHSIQTDISERKASADRMARAAKSATEAHQRLVAAVDALPDAFAYYDAEDRLVLCNERYWKVTPVGTRDEILGKTFEELIRGVAGNRMAAGDLTMTEPWVTERLATHRAPGDPFLLRMLDGRWMKIIEKRTPEGGCVTMLVDVSSEISATARLEDTLDAAKAGIWEWQFREDEPLVIDDRIASMLGHGSAAELGEMTVARWQALIHPEDRRALDDDWDRLRADQDSVSDHIYRIRHRDGHYIWVMSRGRMVSKGFEWSGRSRIGVIIDISQSKRLEAELAAERDYLETLMETSMAAIVALDDTGQIVYCNGEAELLFGLSQEEIAARRFDAPEWQVTDMDGAPMPVEDMPFSMVLQTGKPVRDVRQVLNWPDGRRQIVSVNAAPVERPDNPIRVVCSVRDVTAETAAETALRDAALRAREATEAKSRFLASMSHEIRTPLNGVLGMAELLDLALTDPDHKEMVGVIRESGSLLLSVLNDILDMSKIEAGKLELDPAPFRPEVLGSAVEALHGIAARRKGIDLVVWTGSDMERPRHGDVHRILQILHNLVSNAIKFTDAGEVSVTLTARPGRPLTIRVKDSGAGMTPAQVERVFEEFEQADGSIARRHGGTGLGLAIVNRLVRLMAGEITVDSAPGQGTEIRVSLPLPEVDAIAEDTEAAPRWTGPHDASPLSGLRVLVAEDNATNRLILRAMLDRLGMITTLVADGTEAVTAWKPGAFDLLLLDITMPKMGGIETLAVLRAAATEAGQGPLPAIAITANAMAHQIEEYLAAGFDAHVAKPVSLASIEAALVGLADRLPRKPAQA